VKTIVISQPMFFPWVGMFEQIALADVFVHYDDVPFSKGSFTNRVQIKTSSGRKWLTVPLRKFHLGETIAGLRADDNRPWRDEHLHMLDLAYRPAAYGADMLDLVGAVYDSSDPLPQLLMSSLERVALRLGAAESTEFVRASELGIGGRGWQRVLAVVRRLGGSVYVTGHGARNYLDAAAFEAAGVAVRYMDYACREYPQLNGPFTPHVSVLDLLANTGPDASSAIQPRTVDWRRFLERSAAATTD
jgi:WbqC-like protein family